LKGLSSSMIVSLKVRHGAVRHETEPVVDGEYHPSANHR
jgi:hypothetical protein